MFRIIGADGREYGPVTTDQIHQWIRDRRVDGATRIRPEESAEWTTVGLLPEFAPSLQAPPPVATTHPAAQPYAASNSSADLGASPLPDDVGERDYHLDFGACIGSAWNLLTGPKMGMLLGGFAVVLAIQFGLSIVGQIPLIGLLFALASAVIASALKGGLYAFTLRCIRDQPVEIGHVFDGFRYCFGQLFLGGLVIGLIALAAILPGAAMVGAGAFMLGEQIVVPAAIALLVVGGLAAVLPAIYLSICWLFTLALIIDKRLEFWTAMKLSRLVVSKHWWRVFAFSLVVGVIAASGMLACFIGIFFTMPLGTAALCYGYETLFSEPTSAPRRTG